MAMKVPTSAPAQPNTINTQPAVVTSTPDQQFQWATVGSDNNVYTASITEPGFVSTISNPLSTEPGYGRCLKLLFTATGGTGTVAVAAADAPWNFINMLNFQDAGGNTLFNLDGYSLYLMNKYCGLNGTYGLGDPALDDEYSAINSAGNFQFVVRIPFEYALAEGLVAFGNQSAMPKLNITTNPISTVYSTQPTTAPTNVQVTCDIEFYTIPNDGNILPPNFGSSFQAQVQSGSPTFGANSATIVNTNHLGHQLSGVIFIIRDSTNTRIDAFPGSGAYLTVKLSNTTWIYKRTGQITNDMRLLFNTFDPPYSRETGVIVLSNKDSYTKANLGLLDSGLKAKNTVGGTTLSFQGNTWGSGGTPPYTATIIPMLIAPPSKTLISPVG